MRAQMHQPGAVPDHAVWSPGHRVSTCHAGLRLSSTGVHTGVVGGTEGSAAAGAAAGGCTALKLPFPFVLVWLPASAQAAHAAQNLVCELTSCPLTSRTPTL